MNTTPAGRLRHLATVVGTGAWRVLRQHYFSFVSAIVIAVLFGLVMTSESFVGDDQRPRSASPAAQAAQERRDIPPPRRRLSALYFVLDSEEQRLAVSEAVAADESHRGEQIYDYIVYLIAGTPEQESRTIARLDFDGLFAQQNGIDMRVIDIRTQPVH